ncbi:MAG: DUF2147 domain-containing protein [Bacteroidales bacterium]|nr:DUF2147 domain-containing protein [Bacteroidales bacterium]
MMKHIVLLFLTLCFLNNVQAQQPSDKIVGSWFNEDKTNKIEIYKDGETYSCKIGWLAKLESNPNFHPKDKNNPNPELRNRNILGMDIITGLKYSGEKWVNGTIYTPKRGIYADCEVELLSNGRLKIIVSKSGFTKTQIWTRK